MAATLIDGLILGAVDAIFVAGIGTNSARQALVGLVIGVGYQCALIGWRGQTVGNMAVRTRVVDANTGGPVGYLRGALHYLVEYILFLLLLVPGIVDIFWPLWDRRKQTLHDKAVNTLVVRDR